MRHTETLANLTTMIHHPRSLSRPHAAWRPPSLRLPRVAGHPPLTVSVARHRVGPRARARILGYGQDRTPVYLVSLRVTDPLGGHVDTRLSEGWIRALLGDSAAGAVHELRGSATTYVWLVDSGYRPVPSPASLFADFSDAA